MILRILALCVAAAMICSSIRIQRPEMALAISLAAGVAVIGMLWMEFQNSVGWIQDFSALLQVDGDIYSAVMKAAGIAILAELGAQLCLDAGETALAGRISLASRVAMLGLCGPMLAEMAGLLEEVLP